MLHSYVCHDTVAEGSPPPSWEELIGKYQSPFGGGRGRVADGGSTIGLNVEEMGAKAGVGGGDSEIESTGMRTILSEMEGSGGGEKGRGGGEVVREELQGMTVVRLKELCREEGLVRTVLLA